MGKRFLRFLKDWTLPVAIATGTVGYLTFSRVPALDAAGTALAPVFDTLFPVSVFLTLLVTFCKVDFRQLLPHRWHVGVLAAQLLLVAATVGLVFAARGSAEQKLLWEAVLTCIIGPSASAAPVVVGKLGGNINTMTTFTLISSVVSALLIPAVFPVLEPAAADAAGGGPVAFWVAFLTILQRVSAVVLLPLVLGWLVQHGAKRLCRWVTSKRDLGFYCWCVSLSITAGITVKNIVNSQAPAGLLLLIAAATLLLSVVQLVAGRAVGRWLGDEVNGGQALFQKNTALSIWVAYMYLAPVASIGAGCYVLWQNLINSVELWLYSKKKN